MLKYNDQWQKVKDAAMTTIGKEKGNYPSDLWKISMLLSEHSPIRKIHISYTWENIKSWVSVHFVRHKFGIEHWVSTQRDDRVQYERSADTLVRHEFEANAQAVINMSRKRLCYKAHKETRQKWIEFLLDLKKEDKILFSACVPECVYRGGCPEMRPCGFYSAIYGVENDKILERYKEYNIKREVR